MEDEKGLIKKIKQVLHAFNLNKFYYYCPNDDEFNDNHVDERNDLNFYIEDENYEFIDYIKLDNNKLYYVSTEGSVFNEQQLMHQDWEMLSKLLLYACFNDFVLMNKQVQENQ